MSFSFRLVSDQSSHGEVQVNDALGLSAMAAINPVRGLKSRYQEWSRPPEPRRYVAFQMAEVAIPRHFFADILGLIAELRPPPDAAPA
jgi:hypothetical protein